VERRQGCVARAPSPAAFDFNFWQPGGPLLAFCARGGIPRRRSAAALLPSARLRFQALDLSSGSKRVERAKARREAALYSPQSSKAWIGGAPGEPVCVERTLLSAAFDFDFWQPLSDPEKRESSRSSRTGQQPDARTRELIPPFGDATQPKSPALRFAIGRATPPCIVFVFCLPYDVCMNWIDRRSSREKNLPQHAADVWQGAVASINECCDSFRSAYPDGGTIDFQKHNGQNVTVTITRKLPDPRSASPIPNVRRVAIYFDQSKQTISVTLDCNKPDIYPLDADESHCFITHEGHEIFTDAFSELALQEAFFEKIEPKVWKMQSSKASGGRAQ